MVFLIYALVATAAGTLPWLYPLRSKDKPNSQGTVLVVCALGANFIVGLTLGYLVTPFFYGPFWGMAGTVFIFGLVNGVISFSVYGESITAGSLVYAGVVLLFAGTAVAGLGMFNADDYRSLIGEVEQRNWDEDIAPVDITHIRVVSKEQAEWLGNKVIGEAEGSLGSRYALGDYDIQRVNGELYWVAPLEFRGLFKWLKFDHTVGYVMVSAEDRNRQPELITGREMRYMPSAYFGKDLERHLYANGHATRGLTEYTFELDDEMNPYWVVTVFRPTITYFGPVVEGVVIADPETGESRFYDVENVPEWVDRVYPEDFVERYLTWNGKYVQGWWNSWVGEENVEVPTPYGADGNDVFLVWGSSDNQPYWFTGVTSSSSADQSLTGFTMVNSRTGQVRRYRVAGPNEEAVLQAVNNAVSNYEGWRGTQTILYNIGGEKTWVVPVIGSNNILQRVALVRLSNATVALGDDIREALRDYRFKLASDGFSAAPSDNARYTRETAKTLTRMSTEILGDRTLYYLYFAEIPDRVFTATSDISPELPITRPGEQISFGYIETSEPIVQIDSFDNEVLEIRINRNQQELDERREEVESEQQLRNDTRDAKRELEDLSPEELIELQRLRDSLNDN